MSFPKGEVFAASQAEWEDLIALIRVCQERPESRCLHSDTSEAGLRAELLDLNPPWEQVFRICKQGQRWLGALGCDPDFETGRGWLHGPFLAPDLTENEWQAVAELLFADLFRGLPAGISRLSNYLDLAFKRGLDFHLAQGFVSKGHAYELQALPQLTHCPAEIRPGLPSDAEFLCDLHARAFPGAWLSAVSMLAHQDARHQLLIACSEGQRVGYAFLRQHVELPEASLEYLAVEPAWRGRGFGRKLVLAGLDWIFAQRGLKKALLNVVAENAAALELYRSLGFELLKQGVILDCWRS